MADIDSALESLRRNFFTPNSKRIAEIKGWLNAGRMVPIIGSLNKLYLMPTSLTLAELDYESDKPITLLILSDGGDTEPTFQFIDIINSLNSPVDVIAIGDNCSMAVDLMQACRRRMMLPGARLLVHYIRHTKILVAESPDRFAEDLRILERQMNETHSRRMSLYEKRTGKSWEELEKFFHYGERHGHYLNAKQAIEQGLVDEIVTDFKFFPGRSYRRPAASSPQA